MGSGRIKLMPNKPIGPLKTARLMDIKASICTSMFKSGRIRLLGGVHQSRENLRLTHRKLTQNPPNSQISKGRRGPQFKK